MYEFAYDSAYKSAYDLLPKVSINLFSDTFCAKCVYIRLQLVSDDKLDPYTACMEIVHEIVRGIVHGFVHV